MATEIKVLGIKEAQDLLKNTQKKVDNKSQIGLNRAALFLLGEVKLSIAGHRDEIKSVDTGRFLNSITFKPLKDNAIVFTNLSYAQFLEYGTSKIRPRMHFRNSAFRNKHKVIEIIKKEIR